MKYIKLLAPVIVALVTFLYLAIPLNVFAANERITVSPGARRFDPGSSFTVQVRINSGTSTGAITQANLEYDASKLQVTGSSVSGSKFGTSKPNTRTAGVVKYTSYNFVNAPKGNNLLAYSVTFKAVGTGNTTVKPSAKNRVNSAQNVPTTPVTYSIANAPAPPPAPDPPPNPNPNPNPSPNPNPNPNPNPTPNPTPTPAPTPSTPAPSTPTPNANTSTGNEETDKNKEEKELSKEDPALVISNIRTKILYDKADLFWETNHPIKGTFHYGISEDSLDNEVKITSEKGDPKDPESMPSHSTAITKLRPGVKYFYAITVAKADAGANDTGDTYEGSFTTKGYPVKIIAQQNEQPIAGATVTIKDYDGSYTTDQNGLTSLELKDGTYTVVINKENASAEETITVKPLEFEEGAAPDTQEFKFNTILTTHTVGGSSPLPIIIGVVVLLLLLLFGVIVFLIRRKRQKAQQDGYAYHPIMIGDDDGTNSPPDGYYTAEPAQSYDQTNTAYSPNYTASGDQYAAGYDTPAPDGTQTYTQYPETPAPYSNTSYGDSYATTSETYSPQPAYDSYQQPAPSAEGAYPTEASPVQDPYVAPYPQGAAAPLQSSDPYQYQATSYETPAANTPEMAQEQTAAPIPQSDTSYDDVWLQPEAAQPVVETPIENSSLKDDSEGSELSIRHAS